MKVDSPDMDKRALRQLLRDQYGLCPAVLSFVPQGEESYGYVLETAAGPRYFVKVQERAPELVVCYNATDVLHTQCGLDFVIHPRRARDGECLVTLGKYVVAVFVYVDGMVSDAGGFSDREWTQAACLTAVLHQSVRCPALPSLPVERFDLWFEDWLVKVLAATEQTGAQDGECQRQARALLAAHKDDIVQTLERLKQLAQGARAAGFEPALTHGDLRPENWIRGPGVSLRLMDWTKLAIAPRERDLHEVRGPRFKLFWQAYVEGWAQAPTLRPELLEYYGYFVTLWGLADYGSWILLEDADPSDKTHAWAALQELLPVDHRRIQAAGEEWNDTTLA